MRFLPLLFIRLICIQTIASCQVNGDNNLSTTLNQIGWKHLYQDHDSLAIHYFSLSYQNAIAQADSVEAANAILNLGISSFGSNIHTGLLYEKEAGHFFNQLRFTHPTQAAIGIAKCQQLYSTILFRQHQEAEGLKYSNNARRTLEQLDPSSNTLGLIYTTFANYALAHNNLDTAQYYTEKALQHYIRIRDTQYVASAYILYGKLRLQQNQSDSALLYFSQAYNLSKHSQNIQASVSALLQLSNGYKLSKQTKLAEHYMHIADSLVQYLTDKNYTLQMLEMQRNWAEKNGQIPIAAVLSKKIINVLQTIHLRENEKINSLSNVYIELKKQQLKHQQLLIVHQQQAFQKKMLWIILICTLVFCILILWYHFRLKKQEKQILQTTIELAEVQQKKQEIQQLNLQKDIEMQAQYLNFLTVQMGAKNNLILQINDYLSSHNLLHQDIQLQKILQKNAIQESDWVTFNYQFECVNKHFFTRIKDRFPDLSTHDLKLCALIKLQLSAKDMADILSISPDSVKTARYRLRKKLHLQTEDNLNEFILSL